MSKVEWERTYYNDDSTLYKETPLVNGQIHGVLKYYYRNGQCNFKIPYANGLLHGVESIYRWNGALKEQRIWVNGSLRNDLLGDEHRLKRLILLGGEA